MFTFAPLPPFCPFSLLQTPPLFFPFSFSVQFPCCLWLSCVFVIIAIRQASRKNYATGLIKNKNKRVVGLLFKPKSRNEAAFKNNRVTRLLLKFVLRMLLFFLRFWSSLGAGILEPLGASKKCSPTLFLAAKYAGAYRLIAVV